jgi:hypothetical protein
MRDDFAVIILGYGRPNKTKTLRNLAMSGYTGRWYILVGTDDPMLAEYIDMYGDDKILVFDKGETRHLFDKMTNDDEIRSSVWAYNVAQVKARELGIRYLMVLTDDAVNFAYRAWGRHTPDQKLWYRSFTIKQLDAVFEAMVKLMECGQIDCLSMSQGGDHMGGIENPAAKAPVLKRKSMNSFLFDTERDPIEFIGRANEDATTYVREGTLGRIFLTYSALQLTQPNTQTTDGGLTDLYVELGTYNKSFFTVMASPSSVSIGMITSKHKRIHHKINWKHTVPCILSPDWRNNQKGTIEA